jgi:predicted deacetylase
MYLLRLDDASEYMDNIKWARVLDILSKYSIMPIIGVIPNNEDPKLVSKYEKNFNFWLDVRKWEKSGITICMHGYNHFYTTKCKGLHPIGEKSEFAGVNLEIQRNKIQKAINIFESHNVKINCFFAPSHTYDHNTLKAIKYESDIKIIIDSYSSRPYSRYGFIFIPQQFGKFRNSLFKLTTFCYHPNTMNERDFIHFDKFLASNKKKFVNFSSLKIDKPKKMSIFDKILSKVMLFIHNRGK